MQSPRREWPARQARVAVVRVGRNFSADPGWEFDGLIGVVKLHFREEEPSIAALEAVERPEEAIIMPDLVTDLANDLPSGLIGVVKLHFREEEPSIAALEAVERPEEAIIMPDLVTDL